MAIPSSFAESNCVLGPPEGATEQQIASLSVFRGTLKDTTPIVVSCWKVTQAELEEINRTGRLWLLVIGHTMPPAIVSGTKPSMTLKEPDHAEDI